MMKLQEEIHVWLASETWTEMCRKENYTDTTLPSTVRDWILQPFTRPGLEDHFNEDVEK